MDRKQGRERGNDMQQRTTGGINRLREDIASVYGALALPTEPPGASQNKLLIEAKHVCKVLVI